MRNDDQPVDLLVPVISEREHGPVGLAFAAAHLDAADDAVRPGGGGHLDAVVFGALIFERFGQVDRGGVGAHRHCVDGESRTHGGEGKPDQDRHHGAKTKDLQTIPSGGTSPLHVLPQAAPRRPHSLHQRISFTPFSRRGQGRRGQAGSARHIWAAESRFCWSSGGTMLTRPARSCRYGRFPPSGHRLWPHRPEEKWSRSRASPGPPKEAAALSPRSPSQSRPCPRPSGNAGSSRYGASVSA